MANARGGTGLKFGSDCNKHFLLAEGVDANNDLVCTDMSPYYLEYLPANPKPSMLALMRASRC